MAKKSHKKGSGGSSSGLLAAFFLVTFTPSQGILPDTRGFQYLYACFRFWIGGRRRAGISLVVILQQCFGCDRGECQNFS
jgi:hypothetical protein